MGIKDVENGILSFFGSVLIWGGLLFGLIIILASSGALDSITKALPSEPIQKTIYYTDNNAVVPVQDKNGHYADTSVEYLTEDNGTIKIGKDGNFIKAGEWKCKNGFCAPPIEDSAKYNSNTETILKGIEIPDTKR